jgi:ribosomal protein L25 (general stress protein Ctc)
MAKLQRVTTVTIETRADIGTTGAKKARLAGKIPGALYGHGGSQAISVDFKALSDLITTGGASHVVDATIDGKKESVLLRDVQRNPITHRPIFNASRRPKRSRRRSASSRSASRRASKTAAA